MNNPTPPFNAIEFIGFIITLAAMIYLSFRQMNDKRKRRRGYQEEGLGKERLSSHERPVAQRGKKHSQIPPAASIKPSPFFLQEEKKEHLDFSSLRKKLSGKTLVIHKTILDPPKALDDTFNRNI